MRPVSFWFGVAALAICQGSGAQEFAKAEKPSGHRGGRDSGQVATPATDGPTTQKPSPRWSRRSRRRSTRATPRPPPRPSPKTPSSSTSEASGPRAAPPSGTILAASFADNPGSTIAIQTTALRFLGPDTALEEGRTTITPAGAGPPEISRFTVVYVKHDGQWLQSAVRDEHAHDLTPHDRLKELEWLVGDWINESQDAVVSTTCKWADGGNFLIREFTMKHRASPCSRARSGSAGTRLTSSRPGSSTPKAASAKGTGPATATSG